MKKEWRKLEKEIYLPKKQPALIKVPAFNYFTIKGQSNPNEEVFKDYIAVLYSLSYGARMSYKWDSPPTGYYEYLVYPLEGVWDLADKSKYVPGVVDKSNLAYELMIRQPSFVTLDLANQIIQLTQKKKPHFLLDQVEFKTITEGSCVQMLHLGSYDDEPSSFELMNEYCKNNNLKRASMKHREIYLSDPRKANTENLKTVLRYKVESFGV
ncbi:GyrI-like domain-containing protein [Vallitalea okinawensis]|uniref:GyrI-like domain-containing protein n=1 Tax=Vallitalea okinawensis TaxID=2078660 RepID=UPI000CFBA33C|nr:GyrI-like domain-containing protein [Vallitalea okinawensis]